MAAYKGQVVFVEGVHYPVADNPDDIDDVTGKPRTGADLSRPLRWDTEAGGYRDAEDGEMLHNDTHHAGDIELPVGGE